MEYSAGLTSKLFWLQESRKTADYILKGFRKTDIRKIVWAENIYHVKAEYRAYEVLNGTYRRVAVLPEAGLLESSAKPRTIKPIHINYHTEEVLTANGLENI